MACRWLIRSALAAVAGFTVLSAAAPAWANSTPTLNQTNVFADKSRFGKCTEKPDQAPGEDIWVFNWPGNTVGDLVGLTLHFDSDLDGDADAVRTLADATKTTDQGTVKWWVSTPAGWKLVSGTSEITGTVSSPRNEFQLTHSCAGTTSTTSPPPPASSPATTTGAPPPGGGNGGGGNGGGGLPVTGPAVGGIAATGIGLLVAGAALAVARRRRFIADSTGD